MLSEILWEVKDKEELLHNSALRIEELETIISSIALESQCEIESMKLDIAALEERCFEAERLNEQAVQEKAKMDLLLEMSKSQFQDAQERISSLEMENKYLRQKLVVSEDNADGSCCKVVEHLHNCLKHNSRMNVQGPGRSFPELLLELKKELPLLKEPWGFRKIRDLETTRTIESCNCENCIIACNSYKCSTKDGEDPEALDGDFCNGDARHQALIDGYPGGKDPSTGVE